MGDEVIYAELGRSLYETGRLELLGRPTEFYSLVYPAIIGWPLALWDGETGYEAAKAFQALVMSLAAVPVYLWTRTLAATKWALAASALTLAIPGLAYSGLLMSEVAFYPVMALAAWAIAAALAQPRPRTQAFALLAVALAAATRVQAVVLAPVVLTAVLVDGALSRRGVRSLRRHTPLVLGLALLALTWAAIQFVHGRSDDVLGAYEHAGQTTYYTRDALRFVLWHAADLVVLSAVAPVLAFVVLLAAAVRERRPAPSMTAYLAVTASLAFWLVVEVGIFASRHVGRLAERDLLGALPPLFVGLAVWLDRGARRPRLLLAATTTAIAMALVVLPLGKLVHAGALADAFMLVPLEQFRATFPGANLDVVLLPAVAAVVGAFVFLPRRWLWLLPVALVAVYAAISIPVTRTIDRESARIVAEQVGPDPVWIDRAARRDVEFLFQPGDLHWTTPYEVAFWNRRVRGSYTLPGAEIPGPLPQTRVEVAPDGLLQQPAGTGTPATDVVTRSSLAIAGTPLAHVRESHLILWDVRPPLRLSAWLTGLAVHSFAPRDDGLAVTGQIGSEAHIAIYSCGPGNVLLALRADDTTAVELIRDGTVVQRVTLLPSRTWTGWVPLVPARRGRGQCEVRVRTTGLVEAHRFELVRE